VPLRRGPGDQGVARGRRRRRRRLSISAGKYEAIRREIEEAQDEEFLDDPFGRESDAVFDIFDLPDDADFPEASKALAGRDKAGLLREFGFLSEGWPPTRKVSPHGPSPRP
jgi:hypothetical protein